MFNKNQAAQKAAVAADEKVQADEAAAVAAKEKQEADDAEAFAQLQAEEAKAAAEVASVAAAAEVAVEAPLSTTGPDVEGAGEKAFYIVCLGYPLHHPFQNKLVPQEMEKAVELSMDFWVKTQMEAKLIQVVSNPKA